MTREELIEVMARGICAGQGMYWEDQFSIYSSNGEPSMYDAFKHDATAALAAIEASGVRLVPVGTPTQLIDDDERTTVRIFTPYAPTSPGAITGIRKAETPCSDCIDGWCQMNCGPKVG